MAKREDNLETRFIKLCKLNGFRTIKVDPKKYDGFPDRIVFNTKIGEIHYIELKNNTYYERTHNQKEWAKIIIASGGIYFLLDGDEDVNAYIKKYLESEIWGTFYDTPFKLSQLKQGEFISKPKWLEMATIKKVPQSWQYVYVKEV